MEISLQDKNIFPSQVTELLRSLYSVGFSFMADFESFKVRAPWPEAFFVHKLITAQRRLGEGKKDKDLDQCSIIARQLDPGRLDSVVGSLKVSRKTQKVLRASCEAIDFSPQKLRLR